MFACACLLFFHLFSSYAVYINDRSRYNFVCIFSRNSYLHISFSVTSSICAFSVFFVFFFVVFFVFFLLMAAVVVSVVVVLLRFQQSQGPFNNPYSNTGFLTLQSIVDMSIAVYLHPTNAVPDFVPVQHLTNTADLCLGISCRIITTSE